MLTQTDLKSPRIDLKYYNYDSNIPPRQKVQVMDEDSFEQFTIEWLYGFKKQQYSSISKIGGAGDKGRDIIAYYADGSVDYYQCKHYATPLAPSNYYVELGKLCYYTYSGDILTPKTYYIVASNDVGPKLQDLINHPYKLKEKLLDNWDKYCKKDITDEKEVHLDDGLKSHINNFDFNIVTTYPIDKIIDEHLSTIYGAIRFGIQVSEIKKIDTPAEISHDELPYINALLDVYSEQLGIGIKTPEDLTTHKEYNNHLNRQRKDYYSCETIRRFVRDTLINMSDFDILKEEIHNGIIDTHEMPYSNGYERLQAVLRQAVNTNTSKCLLDNKLHCIGNSERKGTCHMLVNDNLIKWVK